MASLSTASSFIQEAPTRIWQAERRRCLSAPSQSQASTSTRRRSGEGGLCVFSFRKLPASSAQSGRISLLQVAASKRTPGKQRSVVEDPLPYEGDENGDDDEEYVLPELPGEEQDFWEGPQFELLGFIIKYLWAIGIVIALVGCFIAVRLYNEGAADFKETKVYKEAMESQGSLEVPSDSKVFDEAPPSADAPPVAQEGSS